MKHLYSYHELSRSIDEPKQMHDLKKDIEQKHTGRSSKIKKRYP